MKARLFLFAVVLTALFVFISDTGVFAHSYKLQNIHIGHVWSPPVEDGTAYVYGPLMNMGEEADRLLSVKSPVSEEIFIQQKDEEQGEIILETLDLPPGKPVSLAEWGTFVVLHNVEGPLDVGDRFSLILTFEHAGEITVDVDIEEQGMSPH